MKIISFVLSFVSLNLIQIEAYFFPSSQASSPSFQESEVVSSIQELGREISNAQRSKNQNDNVILSPLSIATILNLLLLGANGSTNSELRKVLNYPSDIDESIIHDTFQRMFLSLQKSDSGVQISFNTGLFLQEGFRVLDSYRSTCEKSYFTEIENLDFRGSPIVATEKINRWVASNTKGKINRVFSRPLSRETVCVTCNVIFLNAKWENKFNSRLTRNGIFNSGKENITIPMMVSDMTVPYMIDDKRGFEIISLPYEGKRYSMYILKPLDNVGIGKLDQIEKTLNSAYLDSLTNQMKPERLFVTLPRMRLTQDLDLKNNLKSLGVNRIFSKRFANFERLTDKPGLFVSDIIHKAILEVTEEGTSAAAVTISVISPTSLPGRFIMDKPSLLYIKDNQNGLILFWAKVIKPDPIKIGRSLY